MEKLYETERLIVRRLQESDAADLYDYARDPEVAKDLFIPYSSIDDAHERIRFVRGKYNDEALKTGERQEFALQLKSENKVIGGITYRLRGQKTVESATSLARSTNTKA